MIAQNNISSFELLPVTIISSFGHNGLDWIHSLLDSHPNIVLMPAYSFYRTLDFFKLRFGYELTALKDSDGISKELTNFLFTDPSYKVVRRQFLHTKEQAVSFQHSLKYFLEESSLQQGIQKLFYAINYAYSCAYEIDLSRIKMIISQEHVSWHSLEYQEVFDPKFIFMMRDPRAGLAGSWKRQAENAGLKRVNPFDFDKGILLGTYLEKFYQRAFRKDKCSKIKIMVNEKMHENLELEMRDLSSWLNLDFSSSCLEETFLGKEWLGESSYLGVDELQEKPPKNFYNI